MTIELLSGDDAAQAGGASEFSGFTNPRGFAIDESLSHRAIGLLSEAFDNRPGSAHRLSEAFSTSDFKIAAFAELDKETQAQYAALPSTWKSYTDTTKVRDFRPKRLTSRYQRTVGLARVPELTEYPADTAAERDEYTIQVAKYGRRKAISWEAWLNNEAVQELEDMPADLSRQASETEALAAVSNLLKVDPLTNTAADVNTAFFKTANGNAPDSKPLTRENLKAVLDGMATRKDPKTGRVIARPQVIVVIPAALESQMLSIIKPTEVRRTDGEATVIEGNELASVSYVVEPMLDYVGTFAKAPTTWFVVPKPGSARPALWTAFLAGHETPDLRVKADTGFRAGGGSISAMEGSFEIDDIQYRARHIVGNQTAEGLFTYCSKGS